MLPEEIFASFHKTKNATALKKWLNKFIPKTAYTKGRNRETNKKIKKNIKQNLMKKVLF